MGTHDKFCALQTFRDFSGTRAPVFDADGRVCTSVWITATAPRLDSAASQKDTPLVIEAGCRSSALLRWNWGPLRAHSMLSSASGLPHCRFWPKTSSRVWNLRTAFLLLGNSA